MCEFTMLKLPEGYNGFFLHMDHRLIDSCVGDVTGSIEAGKSADFIVTRRNPLDDLTALRQLELVVCRGRAVNKPAPKRNKTVDALLDPYLA